VLDSYFKLTNKSYLIHRFSYDLIRFFDHLVVAYFFGPPPPSLIYIYSLSGREGVTSHPCHPIVFAAAGSAFRMMSFRLCLRASEIDGNVSVDATLSTPSTNAKSGRRLHRRIMPPSSPPSSSDDPAASLHCPVLLRPAAGPGRRRLLLPAPLFRHISDEDVLQSTEVLPRSKDRLSDGLFPRFPRRAQLLLSGQ